MLPILINIGSFQLYAYPFFIGIAVALAFIISEKFNHKNPYFKFSFLLTCFFAWLGAKVLFLAVANEANQSAYISSTSFWFGGGYVFYGGLIFGAAFLTGFHYFKKDLKIIDVANYLPALVIAHGIGRIGCFLAGCCYGDTCELPWAVHMHGDFRHPVQLYEALALFALGFYLYKKLQLEVSKLRLLSFYLTGYSITRFSLEFFRGDFARGIYFDLFSTSQLISLIFFFVGLMIFVQELKSSKTANL